MNMVTYPTPAAQPWYREPWPWLLMAGPAVVVVAGVITAWIAVATNDGVVADDYYKRGLAINQTLARDALASSRGYQARVHIAAAHGTVAVTMSAGQWRGPLTLNIMHPGRPGRDHSLTLQLRPDGSYAALLPPLGAGHWRVALEDPARTWRLAGELRVPGPYQHLTLELRPRRDEISGG